MQPADHMPYMNNRRDHMMNSPIILQGIGHYFPENILDNAFFEKMAIKTSSEWIEERVGIKARRSVLTKEDILNLRHGIESRDSLSQKNRITKISDMVDEPWQQALHREPLYLITIFLPMPV
jgi:hypothetical protein